MFRKSISLSFLLIAASVAQGLLTHSAWAQDMAGQSSADTFAHEITGGTNSSLSFGGGITNFGFNLGYRYYLFPVYGVQLGYDTDLRYTTSGDNGNTNWNNLFGIRYNLLPLGERRMANQFFIDAGLGFSLQHNSVGEAGATDNKFIYGAGFGKRFEILSNLAWVPEVSFRKVEDSDVNFTLTPLAISVLLG